MSPQPASHTASNFSIDDGTVIEQATQVFVAQYIFGQHKANHYILSNTARSVAQLCKQYAGSRDVQPLRPFVPA